MTAAARAADDHPIGLTAGTATEDTLLLGFGLEQLASDAERTALLEQALGELVG